VTKTILPITEPLAKTCELLDDLVARFLATRRETLPPLGKYEAEIEAQNLFNLAIRHLEGVLALARTDLVLLPPALAASRACFEAAVKAAWLVDADDPFDREARWLVHLASEERYCARIADRFIKLGHGRETLVSSLREREAKIKTFRVAVEAKLPKHVTRLKRSPSFEEMVGSLGGEGLYSFYILLSQSSHAEHQATWSYRAGGLGYEKRVGEFIKPADWRLPLRNCFLSVGRPGEIVLSRLGGKPERFLSAETQERVEKSLNEIGGNVSLH
jgi:Family of unknown function (DUF5677)